jgi:nucleotide-binding universal stress UspA family protein
MAAIRSGQPIVLGIDALRDNHLATNWAADEVQRRGVPLRMIHAVPPVLKGMRVSGEVFHQEQLQIGRHQLDLAKLLAHQRHPDLEVSTDIVEGVPGQVLVRESQEAALVVLGSRELPWLEELFSTYSVTVPVAAQASCPVVVVRRPEDTAQASSHLVVGVDGSTSSAAAFDVALDLAEWRGAAVRAVWAWHRPHLIRVDEPVVLQELHRALVETTAGHMAAHPDVAVTREVVPGHPVQVLADASRHALAVVVGRRGSGGFTGMRIGPVPHGLLDTASCPVITVPGAAEGTRVRGGSDGGNDHQRAVNP